MKDITFILPNLNAGGAERVGLNFLRQLDPCKYDITLIVLDKTTDLLHLVPDGISLIDLGTKSTSRSFWALLRALRSIRPHVVFTTHSRIATLLMLIKPFTPRFKHIARMQSTPSLEKKHSAYGSIRRSLYATGFRSADTVVAQTEEMKADAVTNFGLKPKKITVLQNPLDTVHIDKNLTGAIVPFPSEQIAAVASGRLSYEKGFDVLIAALPFVVEKYPNFNLYILGNDNGEGAKLKKQVLDLALGEHVHFLGFQSNPYLYYRFCDLYILSSRWEGFPNAFLENYYLNTPIVATLCAPIVGDLIQEGLNGFISKVEDIQSLANGTLKAINLSRDQIQNSCYVNSKIEKVL